jgi:bifunctional non-homologous end joining protein LigD
VEHDARPAGASEASDGSLLDGELVARKGRVPCFPHVCKQVLNHDFSTPLTFVVFDLLRIDGTHLTDRPFAERREILESLELDGPWWTTSEAFDDGTALYAALCEHGLEGVVAKKRTSLYRTGERGWIKKKNPDYWRRDSVIEAMQRSRQQRSRRLALR